MICHPLSLTGLYLIELQPHKDQRGSLARVFCKQELQPILGSRDIQQINQSKTTTKGTLRGLHFQYPPQAEAKIIGCLQGRIFDVAVDLRAGSKTFLHWSSQVLEADDWSLLFIPEGFAHGFQSLEDNSELLYLHTSAYSPEYEGSIHHKDPCLAIPWPLPVSHVSDKDQQIPWLDSRFSGIFL